MSERIMAEVAESSIKICTFGVNDEVEKLIESFMVSRANGSDQPTGLWANKRNAWSPPGTFSIGMV